MSYDFKFPDVGEGIAEGEIVKWRVKEGQQVKEHDVLVEIETDKAIVEIPSPKSGVILKIYHKEGDTVKVGETLVMISGLGEAKAEQKAEVPAPKQETPEPLVLEKKSVSVVGELEEATEEKPTTPPKKQPEPEQLEIRSAHIPATPAVRRLARDLGVDLSSMQGSGAGGRITEEDVRKASEQKAEGGPAIKVTRKYDMWGYVDHVPLKGVRKATAKNMVKSFTTAVPVTHMDEADVTELSRIREKEKLTAEKKGIHLTFLPFIIKAIIHALKDHPYLNATLDDGHEEIILKKYYNIGVAVDTPDGLIVPVIKGADQKSILDLAKEIEDLAEKSKNRKLDLMDLKGGTFTITNIGVYGGTHATPVINWPETAILATGRIADRPSFNEKGKVVKRSILPLSLTFDHRVIDGAEAARFMNRIKEHLEDPAMIMIDRD